MKTKMEQMLELIDYGMTHEASDGLREIAVEVPEVNAVLDLMDLGDNNSAAAKLREVISQHG